MEAIRIEGLTKSFGSVQALRGLSMSVDSGTICGFIGPNGAGKTTTLRILLGLLPRDGGGVSLLGEDVVFGRELARRSRVAYLPQDPVFPERHTGREVMDLVAALYGMPPGAARQRSEELLNQFHLTEAQKLSVGSYSRGMKQRLGLATCFLPEPDLVVLDEPVSALDPEGRVETFALLRQLKGRSTVLFSSHILEDVERVSDTLVMVRAGRTVVEGSMEEVLSLYAGDRLRIAVHPDDEAKAKAALETMPWVTSVSAKDGPIGVIYADVRRGQMDTAVDGTLACLVGQGIRVREFGRSVIDLETVFLRLSAD
ncbi:MAG: ABC transporter ATP-binding protein [Bacillota bacterium]